MSDRICICKHTKHSLYGEQIILHAVLFDAASIGAILTPAKHYQARL